MTTTLSTVKGEALGELVGQDQAVKIQGRWYWFIGYHGALESDRWLSSGTGFAIVVPVRLDPRLAKRHGVQHAGRRASCFLRIINRNREYQVRAQARTTHDWVTKLAEREGF